MKLFHAFLAILFALFIYFQWNDPDGILWMIIYGYVFLNIIFTLFNLKIRGAVDFGMVGFLLGILYFSPTFIDWIQSGMPSITGQMKAESPFIETIREFLGLLLCLITMIYLFFYDRFRRRKRKA